jgi:RNA polymerase sigma factor (sigma-70 family)
MAADTVLEHSESHSLATDAARARAADRDLAAALGRPEPRGSTADGDHLHRLLTRPRLSPEDHDALIEAAKRGDEHARERLIDEYLPRITAVSRRYALSEHVERLELVQEGVVGLLQALERYDPGRGTPFWVYAQPYVQRAMQRLVAELGDAAVLSDHALQRLSRLKTAEDELMQEKGHAPSSEEIIARAGVDREEAEKLLAATRPPRSLQEPITADDGGVIGSLGDLVDDPRALDDYDSVLDAIEAEELLPLLGALSDRELMVLRLHYGLEGEPQSYKQIAERLGVSTRRVRDRERRALAKLARVARAVGASR